MWRLALQVDILVCLSTHVTHFKFVFFLNNFFMLLAGYS